MHRTRTDADGPGRRGRNQGSVAGQLARRIRRHGADAGVLTPYGNRDPRAHWISVNMASALSRSREGLLAAQRQLDALLKLLPARLIRAKRLRLASAIVTSFSSAGVVAAVFADAHLTARIAAGSPLSPPSATSSPTIRRP